MFFGDNYVNLLASFYKMKNDIFGEIPFSNVDSVFMVVFTVIVENSGLWFSRCQIWLNMATVFI